MLTSMETDEETKLNERIIHLSAQLLQKEYELENYKALSNDLIDSHIKLQSALAEIDKLENKLDYLSNTAEMLHSHELVQRDVELKIAADELKVLRLLILTIFRESFTLQPAGIKVGKILSAINKASLSFLPEVNEGSNGS